MSLSSTKDEMPRPVLSANRSKKTVEATHEARLRMTRLVCIFLRSKSFTENAVSLVSNDQSPFFKDLLLMGQLYYMRVMCSDDNCFPSALHGFQYLRDFQTSF